MSQTKSHIKKHLSFDCLRHVNVFHLCRYMDGEACVWHGAGGTPEEEQSRDRSTLRGLRHDAAGDRHEGRGKDEGKA